MPKVTAIKQQQKRQDRYSVYVDGKYSFSLSEDELVKSGLRKDQELSQPELAKVQKTAVLDKAYDRCLRYLSIRSRSQWEIEDYLRRKGYEEPLAGLVLAKLKLSSLVDDAAFARQWVQWRLNSKPSSKRRLQSELIKKRIDRDIIDEVLNEIDTDVEFEQVQALAERKQRLSQYQDRQKLIAYLARQGFSYDLIKRALKE